MKLVIYLRDFILNQKVFIYDEDYNVVLETLMKNDELESFIDKNVDKYNINEILLTKSILTQRLELILKNKYKNKINIKVI